MGPSSWNVTDLEDLNVFKDVATVFAPHVCIQLDGSCLQTISRDHSHVHCKAKNAANYTDELCYSILDSVHTIH